MGAELEYGSYENGVKVAGGADIASEGVDMTVREADFP